MHITRELSVCPLVDITDPEFEHQYELGVWWAMYGDEQGKGPYDDEYLIGNVSRYIKRGWHNDMSIGFYLGMIHGGWLVKPSDTIAILTDPDFTRGYKDGFGTFERLTDTSLTETINACASACSQVLAYELGKLTGTLSHALSLAPMPVTGRS